MIPEDQLSVGRSPDQAPAPPFVPALEVERLRAEADRLVADMNGPLAAVELDRLRGEEVRIREKIEQLTSQIDGQLEINVRVEAPIEMDVPPPVS